MELKPKINNFWQTVINDKDKLRFLINNYGSPLNILNPSSIKENINNFKKVLEKYHLNYHIHYAHKVNKSSMIVKEVLNNNIGIDVASYNELKHALTCGYQGYMIEATGPKNDDFIILGLRHNILFNCDNLEEVKTIIYYHKKMNKNNPTNILIRLNNFKSGQKIIINNQSRFGIDISDIDRFFALIKENTAHINFKGFSFHLDTINMEEKIIAISSCLDLFNKARSLSLEPNILNIGGGFGINYLANKEDWQTAMSIIQEDILTQKYNNRWNDQTFGLRNNQGVIRGVFNVPNYYYENDKAKDLNEILSTELPEYQDRQVGEILEESMIELMIEPGKALIDEVGITVSKVIYSKDSMKKELLVGLDMNRSNLVMSNQELFVNPIHISFDDNKITNKGYLLGNLCMESDVFYKYRLDFKSTPKKDDLFIFMNTAPYSMDFTSANPIMQNKASKIILDDKLNVYLDENYEPLKENL